MKKNTQIGVCRIYNYLKTHRKDYKSTFTNTIVGSQINQFKKNLSITLHQQIARLKTRQKIAVACELYQYSLSELSKGEQELVLQSIEAAETAFAPYSKFKVGAAALLENGTTVIGSNQENAAYPSGLCAERVALFAAGSQHHGIQIQSLAVFTPSFANAAEVPMPCGSCRQVMQQSEFHQNSSIRILLVQSKDSVYIAESAETLLPFPFQF